MWDPAAAAGGTPAAGGQPSGIVLDPLVGLNDSTKPLRSRLLSVPSLKARYLDHVRTIALDWLDWHKLKPLVEEYRSLIAAEIEADTRKLTSYAAFEKSLADAEEAKAEAPRGRQSLSLEAFAKQRRAFLLNYPGIRTNAPTP